MKWVTRERPKIDCIASHNFSNDHEMLRHGMILYDALYNPGVDTETMIAGCQSRIGR